ncbi:hypothetical protein D1AOALGA4SA_4425 [Olavius algarvensis Delta 1 endosymbiont]|nr:hypothetical protein D1AOALGA4SA_4425 [Olavius algarvensis Delta 1 endosymbiont]
MLQWAKVYYLGNRICSAVMGSNGEGFRFQVSVFRCQYLVPRFPDTRTSCNLQHVVRKGELRA